MSQWLNCIKAPKLHKFMLLLVKFFSSLLILILTLALFQNSAYIGRKSQFPNWGTQSVSNTFIIHIPTGYMQNEIRIEWSDRTLGSVYVLHIYCKVWRLHKAVNYIKLNRSLKTMEFYRTTINRLYKLSCHN